MTTPEKFVAPAWLLAAADQRLALMDEAIGSVVKEAVAEVERQTGQSIDTGVDVMAKMVAGDIIMTPLAEPREGASPEEFDQWERRCDNCGAYCPEGQVFFTGHLSRTWHATQVLIMFGMCPLCKDTP